MKDFFKVTGIADVLAYKKGCHPLGTELISIHDSCGRVLAEDIVSGMDLPGFTRSTMDGYAVKASSTFGASEGSPGFMNVAGTILMGETPRFTLKPGEAAKISTGGMLPDGADSVVMVEYTEPVDESTIEVYKSVAPGQHVVQKGEDLKHGACILRRGDRIRPQEMGLLASLGKSEVPVFRKPLIGIISTGDEVVGIDETPALGQIRDINSHSLGGLIKEAGGMPIYYGVISDNEKELEACAVKALSEADMVLVSGGSSVGTRDYTIQVLEGLEDSEILVHGISISPGKPTIMARAKDKFFWGLPGHVVSAMVVFSVVVKPFIESMTGLSGEEVFDRRLTARLTRNIPSAQGRTDYVRVRLMEDDGALAAEPVLGKSGLISTMVKADGLVEVDENTEGLDGGALVKVMPV